VASARFGSSFVFGQALQRPRALARADWAALISFSE